MFFLAGGYAAAAPGRRGLPEGGAGLAGRMPGSCGCWRPTSWFVGMVAGATGVAALLGAPASVLAQAGWGVALQLWFLPVYLLLLVLAVPMITAWNRARWLLLAAGIAVVVAVDVLVRGHDVTGAGWVNYVVAPAAGLVLGIAWHAGALARRAVPIALLVAAYWSCWCWLPASAIPVDDRRPRRAARQHGASNLALAAYSSAQIGLVLLLEGPGRRLLQRPRIWGRRPPGQRGDHDHVPVAHGPGADPLRAPCGDRPADRPASRQCGVVGWAHPLDRTLGVILAGWSASSGGSSAPARRARPDREAPLDAPAGLRRPHGVRAGPPGRRRIRTLRPPGDRPAGHLCSRHDRAVAGRLAHGRSQRAESRQAAGQLYGNVLRGRRPVATAFRCPPGPVACLTDRATCLSPVRRAGRT